MARKETTSSAADETRRDDRENILVFSYFSRQLRHSAVDFANGTKRLVQFATKESTPALTRHVCARARTRYAGEIIAR